MGSDVTFPLIALTRARTYVAHRENPSLPVTLSLWKAGRECPPPRCVPATSGLVKMC